MVLINPIGFRLNYNHLWKYRNIVSFDQATYSQLVKESYFFPIFLQRLFERRVFRRFDMYFSHLVVHQFNNGKTLYNVFIGSKLFHGVSRWFFRIILPHFYESIYRFIKLKSNSTAKLVKLKRKRGNKKNTIKNNFKSVELLAIKRLYKILQFKKLFKLFSCAFYTKLNVIHNYVLHSFKRAIKNYSFSQISKIKLYAINEHSPSALSLGSEFMYRLRRGSSLNRLIFTTLNKVKKRKYKFVKGIRIVCEGRFKRRQRAQHNVYNAGKVKTSSMNAKVDYSLNTVYLKYGAGSVRIWLNYV